MDKSNSRQASKVIINNTTSFNKSSLSQKPINNSITGNPNSKNPGLTNQKSSIINNSSNNISNTPRHNKINSSINNYTNSTLTKNHSSTINLNKDSKLNSTSSKNSLNILNKNNTSINISESKDTNFTHIKKVECADESRISTEFCEISITKKNIKEKLNQVEQIFVSFSNNDYFIIKSENRYLLVRTFPDDKTKENEYKEITWSSNSLLQLNSLGFNNNILIAAKNNGDGIITDANEEFFDFFDKYDYNISQFTISPFETFTNILKNSSKIQSNLVKKYIKSVTCGSSHCLFLTQAGMIFSLGKGDQGQLGLSSKKETQEPTIITSMLNYRALSISSGNNHNIILATTRDLQVKSDDLEKELFVFVFGDNKKGQCGIENVSFIEVPKINEFFSGKNIRKIECGGNHSSALIKDKDELLLFGYIRPDIPAEKPVKVDYRLTGIELYQFKDFINTESSVFCLSKDNDYVLVLSNKKALDKEVYKVNDSIGDAFGKEIYCNDNRILQIIMSSNNNSTNSSINSDINNDNKTSNVFNVFKNKNIIRLNNQEIEALNKERLLLTKRNSSNLSNNKNLIKTNSSNNNENTNMNTPNPDIKKKPNVQSSVLNKGDISVLNNMNSMNKTYNISSELNNSVIPAYDDSKNINDNIEDPLNSYNSNNSQDKEINSDNIKSNKVKSLVSQLVEESQIMTNDDNNCLEEEYNEESINYNIEKSMDELRDYISLVGISYDKYDEKFSAKKSKTKTTSTANTVISSLYSHTNDANTNINDISFPNNERLKTDHNTDVIESKSQSKITQYGKSLLNNINSLFKSNQTKSNLTFRPKNLPKKTQEEEYYHRMLVEENRKRYLENLEKKKLEDKKRKQLQEKKRLRLRELEEIWTVELIPKWYSIKNNNSVKKYFYEGIPPSIRGNVWLLSIGNQFSITKEYYEIELKKAVDLLIISNEIAEKENSNYNKSNKNVNDINKSSNSNNSGDSEDNKLFSKYNITKINKEHSIRMIDLDIERTFSYIGLFKQGSPLAENLREILRAFVASRPDIGYIQGLSYIGGLLLIYMDKFQAFVALLNLVLNVNIIPFYRFDDQQIKRRFQIFKQVFYHNLPELCDYFEEIDLLPEYYMVEWMMTLFSKNLNIDLAARVWDIYMIEGIKAIYQVGIVLLSHFEKKILNGVYEFEEILKELKSLNEVNFDDDELVNSMKAVKFPDWVEVEIKKLNDEYIPIY